MVFSHHRALASAQSFSNGMQILQHSSQSMHARIGVLPRASYFYWLPLCGCAVACECSMMYHCLVSERGTPTNTSRLLLFPFLFMLTFSSHVLQ